MPPEAVHRNASTWSVDVPFPIPTTTAPFAETPLAMLLNAPPGISPIPLMPVGCVQRQASLPELDDPSPTIVVPSLDTPNARLNGSLSSEPTSCMPVPEDHRNAS